MKLRCRSCPNLVTCNDGTTWVQCGRCFQFRSRSAALTQKEAEKSYTPEALVKLRKEKGWTQSDLAAKLKLPPYRVSHFEQGKAGPPLKVQKFMDAEKKG